ncbi:SOS response-associated peptidase family protein [Desulfofarcimen acetoxidans]|uniref:SOS response-associated peptidase family protein n=1 Tax=Desulfofarcimen acetoxidans TaxID=58138 RepID=UPI0009FF2704|nr:SOS response-associated peptidase family protein [Desulfofarcimen acetoxidans]
MCGRFTLTTDVAKIKNHFHLNAKEFKYNPRSLNQRVISLMRWGLIPRWAKEQSIGYKLINARSETVEQKPAFRDSFHQRHCLIPTDGFFEWNVSA